MGIELNFNGFFDAISRDKATNQKKKFDLAHELWAAAQCAPEEGIEDAVARIVALLQVSDNRPRVPDSVLAYVHAYGDARADDDGSSAQRLLEAITAIRNWCDDQLCSALALDRARHASAKSDDTSRWFAHGLSWALAESMTTDNNDEWTTEDVANAYEAGARHATEACAKLFDVPESIHGEAEDWSRSAAALIRRSADCPF